MMDKLIMNINDYKSINQANIEINKLNVVSGVNGSGKSTVSRIFYSFLKGNSTKRRDYLFERIVDQFNLIIRMLDQKFVDYDFPDSFKVTDTIEEIFEKYNALCEITESHEKLCPRKIEEIDKKLPDEFDSVLKKLEKEGVINIDEIEVIDDPIFSNKILELEEFIPDFDNRFEKDFKKVFELEDEKDYFFNTQTINSDLNSFYKPFKLFIEEDSYVVSGECVQSLLIKEERGFISKETLDFEVEISNNSKINAYEYFFNKGFIDNVYYFDNVSIFDLYLLNSDFKHVTLRHTNEFIDELFDKNHKQFINRLRKNFDEPINLILEKIESIIGGRYTTRSLPVFITDKIITYPNTSYTRNVSTISDTPSGIKQMGIIQLLLLNNKLKKGDYLIIDEPEVNLHPDWQFKFAEILVLLAKLGIIIYINSHSPLFVEAITAFCEYYDMEDDVNYYLTEPSEVEEKYDFVKIKSDERFRVYDNLGNAYDLIDQLRLKKRFGE